MFCLIEDLTKLLKAVVYMQYEQDGRTDVCVCVCVARTANTSMQAADVLEEFNLSSQMDTLCLRKATKDWLDFLYPPLIQSN